MRDYTVYMCVYATISMCECECMSMSMCMRVDMHLRSGGLAQDGGTNVQCGLLLFLAVSLAGPAVASTPIFAQELG